MDVLPGNIIILASALLVGLAFGFVLQRGRFCMNTAFRDIIFINDMTLFRTYFLALIIAIVGANLLEDFHLLGAWTDPDTGQVVFNTLRRQDFAPIANIVGGYLFGLGIVLAGGCGSGILYRVGEGLVAAVVAVLGFGMGILTTTHGVLRPVYKLLRSYTVTINGNNGPALWDLFGGTTLMAKWITIAVVVTILAIVVLKGKPFQKTSPAKGFKWTLTGLLVGAVAVIAWWASGVYGGSPRGLSFTGPTGELFEAVISGNSKAGDQMFNLWGVATVSWSALYIITVPVGAYLSAAALGEFKLKAPAAAELMTVFFGSLLMGFGASVAGGCNIGHGLTGVSTLAISSIVATVFILLGNWTMVYFKFIRPMQD